MPVSDALIQQRVDEAVSDYLAYHRDDGVDELDFYRAMPTVPEAITRAARAHTSHGGKHPHQWRIPCDVLREFGRRLSRRERALQEAPSFDELHQVVQEAGRLIRRIGELAVYDTALRIGAKLDLPPTQVYLHRGTRDGAAEIGIDPRRPSIAVAELPRAFAVLEPHEIEDCLCIFKGLLSDKPSLRATGCRCSGRGCARDPSRTAQARC